MELRSGCRRTIETDLGKGDVGRLPRGSIPRFGPPDVRRVARNHPSEHTAAVDQHWTPEICEDLTYGEAEQPCNIVGTHTPVRQPADEFFITLIVFTKTVGQREEHLITGRSRFQFENQAPLARQPML